MEPRGGPGPSSLLGANGQVIPAHCHEMVMAPIVAMHGTIRTEHILQHTLQLLYISTRILTGFELENRRSNLGREGFVSSP